jgi:hypothetical protein
MKETSVVDDLRKSGRITDEAVARWGRVSGLLAALDAVGRDGANAMVKIDGARPNGEIYTVVVSGGKLGDAFFRKDGADVDALLRDAVSFYREHAWSST